MKRLAMLLGVLLLGAGLVTGCGEPESEEGPAERTGERLDQTGEAIKEKTKEGIEETGEALEGAGEKLGEVGEED